MAHLTIRDIARMANVSVTTVSRALNDAHDIRPDTKARILALCQEHDWHANELARSLTTSRSHIFGIILPDISNSYYNTMALHAELRAREKGYSVLLCNAHSNDPHLGELFDYMISQRVDGIMTHTIRQKSYAELVDRNIPFVLLGQNTPEFSAMRVNSVYSDNYIGGKIAAEYLCRLGHKNILYVGYRDNSHTQNIRLKGFLETANQLGVNVSIISNPDHSSSIESGYHLGSEYFKGKIEHTAVFAVSDLVAIGFIEAADNARISIPDEISILGYDNLALSALSNIKLSTVAQPLKKIGRTGVDMLLSCIDRDETDMFSQVVFIPQLIERGTCKNLLL